MSDSLQRQDSNSSARNADPEDDLGSLNVFTLIKVAWQERFIIAAITAAFAILSVAYALMATQWYEAEVLLAPADDQSVRGLAGQFGGFAELAGISVSNEGKAEPIAVLRSREFVRDFITEKNLLPVLYSDEWDSESGRWAGDSPESQPDMRDAIKMFREDMLKVSDDPKTGLVTVRVEWVDAETAANWANDLVERLNARMRERALAEAQRNVEYLQSELRKISVVPVQQSVGSLLEAELKTLMLARGSEEYSFRIVDPAYPPKYRSRPRRTLLVISSTMFGGMLGFFFALARRALRPGETEIVR